VAHQDAPLVEVGELACTRTPQNYCVEVEQAAFSPSHIVPGMGCSPDQMLQARGLSSPDAHRSRLGVHYESLPVNRPHATEAHPSHRDGAMRFDDHGGGAPNYEPNGFDGPVEDSRFREPPLKISGDADRYDHHEGNDDYTQAGDLFRLMTAAQRGRLIANIVAHMASVPCDIQLRQIEHFRKADPDYGNGVAEGLGVTTQLEAIEETMALRDLGPVGGSPATLRKERVI
jgi:catalase